MVNHPTSSHAGVEQPAEGLWAFASARFLLLPLGAVIALVWANTWPERYFGFSHAWSFGVNEIAMALFLGLIAQELFEDLLPGGALHTWRRWGFAVIAGVGAFLGAAGVFMVYVQWTHETVLSIAWPVACAVDIAAGYYVLKLIWRQGSALSLLLLIAVVTDTLGLMVVTLRSPAGELSAGGIALALVAIAIAAAMRRANVRSIWAYVALPGAICWAGLYWAGLHPALALVPIVPFVPHRARSASPFAEPAHGDAVYDQERHWNWLVQAVLFLFGLVNAGVLLRGYDTGTWAILAAALVGRPAGILAAAAIGAALGLHLPVRLGWRGLIVVALATTSGFTFALFFTTGVMPIGPAQAQIKLGALTTFVGAFLTLGVAWLLGVGRFTRPVTRESSQPLREIPLQTR